MTNANGISPRKNRIFDNIFTQNSKSISKCPEQKEASGVSRVSVGFEKKTRYIRRVASAAVSALPHAQRKAYVAPDAQVLLTPSAISQAAQWELMFDSKEDSLDKRERVSLRERIKKAAHRESEYYTLYGVNTGEIFTEEIEIDVMSGAAFASATDINNKEASCEGFPKNDRAMQSGDFSSRCSAAAVAFKKMHSGIWIKFKDFAYKVNNFWL
ncbi:MAG: hypothetical protein E7635_04695 [Ruminococcaceae bacterium]|nr:hypothetical protein [Oscillospiraceae bacterium]